MMSRSWKFVSDGHDLTLIGDKAYNDANLEDRLWRTRRILLLLLRKHKQRQQGATDSRKALGRIRHNVETAFSTLCTTFNVGRPRERSLAGHVVALSPVSWRTL